MERSDVLVERSDYTVERSDLERSDRISQRVSSHSCEKLLPDIIFQLYSPDFETLSKLRAELFYLSGWGKILVSIPAIYMIVK